VEYRIGAVLQGEHPFLKGTSSETIGPNLTGTPETFRLSAIQEGEDPRDGPERGGTPKSMVAAHKKSLIEFGHGGRCYEPGGFRPRVGKKSRYGGPAAGDASPMSTQRNCGLVRISGKFLTSGRRLPKKGKSVVPSVR